MSIYLFVLITEGIVTLTVFTTIYVIVSLHSSVVTHLTSLQAAIENLAAKIEDNL